MKVKKLLSDKSKWTQCVYARKADGKATTSFDPAATCWCLAGAINVCYMPERRYPIFLKLTEAIDHLHKMGKTKFIDIPGFNDNSTYEEVMELVNELDI